jgi:nucleoside recognition membrane protein YjiH
MNIAFAAAAFKTMLIAIPLIFSSAFFIISHVDGDYTKPRERALNASKRAFLGLVIGIVISCILSYYTTN